MANKILFTFFYLLFRTVFLLPIAKDSESVQVLNSARDLKSIESTELDLDTALSEADSVHDLVQSMNRKLSLSPAFELPESFNADSVKRIRKVREVIRTNHTCPKDMIWYAVQCLSLELYKSMGLDKRGEKTTTEAQDGSKSTTISGPRGCHSLRRCCCRKPRKCNKQYHCRKQRHCRKQCHCCKSCNCGKLRHCRKKCRCHSKESTGLET